MIKVEEARKVVLENVKPVGIEKVEILLSIDRVLAEDIYSTLDLSPFDHSAMDGYAVISSDTVGASVANPKVLEVIEDIPAGYVASKELGQGQAARIMTGAPIPSGADAVIVVEDTEKESSKVKIFSEVDRGENIRLRGEDVKKGELIIPKGKRIGSAEVGMLAALNIGEVEVAKRPQVAILSTGDELVEVGEDLEPGKIRNSNSYSLYALVHKYGGVPTILGIAKDVKKEVEDKVRKGLSFDMLIISGGVSAGDYDFVKDVLAEMGMEIKFWKVAMKPGKPLLFGMIGEVPIFGLPGNPVSSMVTFELFVGQALLKMQGKTKLCNPIIRATSEEVIKKEPGRKNFIRGIVSQKNGRYYVKTTGTQSSGAMKSMILANGLIIVPEEVSKIDEGEEVEVHMLNIPEC